MMWAWIVMAAFVIFWGWAACCLLWNQRRIERRMDELELYIRNPFQRQFIDAAYRAGPFRMDNIP